jgi:hypothetical protein
VCCLERLALLADRFHGARRALRHPTVPHAYRFFHQVGLDPDAQRTPVRPRRPPGAGRVRLARAVGGRPARRGGRANVPSTLDDDRIGAGLRGAAPGERVGRANAADLVPSRVVV